jgi:hypothetical protein
MVGDKPGRYGKKAADDRGNGEHNAGAEHESACYHTSEQEVRIPVDKVIDRIQRYVKSAWIGPGLSSAIAEGVYLRLTVVRERKESRFQRGRVEHSGGGVCEHTKTAPKFERITAVKRLPRLSQDGLLRRGLR